MDMLDLDNMLAVKSWHACERKNPVKLTACEKSNDVAARVDQVALETYIKDSLTAAVISLMQSFTYLSITAADNHLTLAKRNDSMQVFFQEID